MSKLIINRRGLLKAGAVGGLALSTPMHFIRGAYAADQSCNMPTGANVVFGFNVPLSGPYAMKAPTNSRPISSPSSI